MESNWHKSLIQIISYLESTRDDEWLTERCRSEDGTKNCLLGHIFNMGGDDDKLANQWTDFFMYAVATEYMFFPVNDGEHPDYQQPAPKDRCIAYCRDLLSGKAKNVMQLMKEESPARVS